MINVNKYVYGVCIAEFECDVEGCTEKEKVTNKSELKIVKNTSMAEHVSPGIIQIPPVPSGWGLSKIDDGLRFLCPSHLSAMPRFKEADI